MHTLLEKGKPCWPKTKTILGYYIPQDQTPYTLTKCLKCNKKKTIDGKVDKKDDKEMGKEWLGFYFHT